VLLLQRNDATLGTQVCDISVAHLVALLQNAGIPWKSYDEDISGRDLQALLLPKARERVERDYTSDEPKRNSGKERKECPGSDKSERRKARIIGDRCGWKGTATLFGQITV
jgi:hypothetical protein